MTATISPSSFDYAKTLDFIAFMALSRLYPDNDAIAEYSVGRGLYITVKDRYLTADDLTRIEEEIRSIAESKLPIREEFWSREKAIAYFRGHNRPDKAELLSRLHIPEIRVYRCEEYVDDLYDDILPNTGMIKAFGVISFFPGFVLQMSASGNVNKVSRFNVLPKHLLAFALADQWGKLTRLQNAADFYKACENHGMRNYIRVNEVLHDEEIGTLADQILHSGKKLVMIAGPSSSGKTTFAARLGIHLMVRGKRFIRLSLDDYYRNRCDLAPDADGKIDLESLNALDVPLIFTQLSALIKGEEVEIPRFNFNTKRREDKGIPTRLGENDILIVEGIHGLNPALVERGKAFLVFISPLTCLNLDNHNRIHTRDIRLLRRLVRDRQFRGTPPEATLNMWSSVKDGEDRWIFTYQEMADFVFNSALNYELPILKKYAYPMLLSCDPNLPNVRHLLKLLEKLPDLDDELLDEIPPLSLLREFIGGCTVEK